MGRSTSKSEYRIWFLLLIIAVTGTILPCPRSVRAQEYQFTLLPFLIPQAINNNGTIVGYTSPGGTAFVWSAGSSQLLNGGNWGSVAYGINDSGQIVGKAYDSGHGQHAATWQNGVMTDLHWPAGLPVAYAINNSGTIVGTDNNAGIETAAGTTATLPTGPNYKEYTIVSAINDAGVIVGYGDGGSSAILVQAQVWSGSTVTGLTALPQGSKSSAAAINNFGQIVGWSDVGTGTYSGHAVMWENGVTIDLEKNNYSQSRATDINDAGLAVGFAYSGPDSRWVALLFSGGQEIALDSLVVNSMGTDHLGQAFAINNSGWIVGETVGGHGFLLTPVPEPTALALLSLASAALLMHRRCRR